MVTMTNSNDKDVPVGDLKRVRRTSGKSPVSQHQSPDSEVMSTAKRRRFTREYKLSILEKADHCTDSGAVGALLRSEGLYSSHLSNWRRLRKNGMLDGLASKKRGPKSDPNRAQLQEVARLQKRINQLEGELSKAHTIIDVQKKLSAMLAKLPQDENGS